MKIGIPNDGESINPHFGRTKSFIIANVENGKVIGTDEMSTERFQHDHLEVAQFLKNSDVSVVISGGMGASAYDTLKQENIEVVRGAEGQYSEAINAYLNGHLKDKEVTCSHDGAHHQHR